nr:helix-turn-helix domain-containing protein [Alteromonas flava]
MLSPQCGKLMQLLLSAAPEIVERQRMKADIWGHTYVSDDVINHLVCRLRKELHTTFGEDVVEIETIPQLGYRLVCKGYYEHNGMVEIFHRCSEWIKHWRD